MHGFWEGGFDAYLEAIVAVHREAERRLKQALALASSADEQEAIEAELQRRQRELDRQVSDANYSLF